MNHAEGHTRHCFNSVCVKKVSNVAIGWEPGVLCPGVQRPGREADHMCLNRVFPIFEAVVTKYAFGFHRKMSVHC
jgi:hypothetical protein